MSQKTKLQKKGYVLRGRLLFRVFTGVLMIVLGVAGYGFMHPTVVRALNNAPSHTVVINQVYPGGGNASATYTNDYVELLNLSNVSVDISGWSIQYQPSATTTWTIVNLCATTTPGTCVLGAGHYYLVQLASGGANGVALPVTPDRTSTGLNLAAAQGKIGLVNSTTTLTAGSGVCASQPITGSPAVIDFVGWGTNTNPCSETAPATGSLSSTQAIIRTANADTDNNSTDFAITASPVPRNTVTTPISPTAADATIAGRILTNDGSPVAGVTIKLEGTMSARAITDSNGAYRFTNVETSGFYTVTPKLVNYSFNPASRSFSLLGSQTDAAFSAENTGQAMANPLDTTEYFVRQQYVDFLSREPDQGGLNYWSAQLDQCLGDGGCLSARRAEVSAAFFMEKEFQDSGYYLYRLYGASYARKPAFAEFMPDRASLTGGANLEQSKQAFAEAWVGRAQFKQAYPDAMAASAFVNKLYDNAGVIGNFSEREAQINAMAQGKTRTQVLLDVIENASFKQQEFNSAFVLTEYFSYLRRDPDEAGLNFWLNVLNTREPNNYKGMVCSFITSAEYQKRFSPVASRSNSECGQ